MALTPAEQHHKSAMDDFRRTTADAESVVSNLGYTDAEHQAATAQLDAAQQQMDAAWDAVQNERYGPDRGYAR